MHRLQRLAVGLFGVTLSVSAHARDFYVAPTGSDTAAGSEAAPFATFARAQQAAAAGDSVYFRAGTYLFTSSSAAEGLVLNKSGTAAAPIQYLASPGERPVLDFMGLTAPVRIKGLSVTGSYIRLKGFEIRNVRQNTATLKESWGVHVNGGDNNIFEQLDIHNVQGPGFFLEEGANNLVVNVDSHHNYDDRSYDGGPTPGENGDGFGCHSTDAGNVFRACRAWWNSDDGFDFINSPGRCLVEHSWAFRNGFVPGTTTAIGNGAGIKAGGFTNNVPATIPRHRAAFNVSFANRRQGFYANHQNGIDFINNTAFDNGQRNFDLLGDVTSSPMPHLVRNNVAFGTGATFSQAPAGVDNAFNSWNLMVTVSAADFVSVDTALATAPREADGSLPNNGFMKLAAGSDLLDKGQAQMGYPFVGAAPDLGAFESGAQPVGTGGMPGTGGSAGNAGSAAGGTLGSAGASPAGAGGSNSASGGSTAGTVGTNAGSGGTLATAGAGGVSTGGVSTGGASPTSGGAGAAAGAFASGGASGAGAPGTGGVAAGGAIGNAGAAVAGSSAAGQPGGEGSGESGCQCRAGALTQGGRVSPSLLVVGALALVGALRRRRRARAQRAPLPRHADSERR